jgi:23S rRNA (adenine2030-N6)-methyltransferase
MIRILLHLQEKPAAFRVLDTHAGAGIYDLAGAQASRTGEWREGIGRLSAARLDADAERLIAPYRRAVARFNHGEEIVAYPGSPALARAFLRPQDRLVACELEPGAAQALKRSMRGDERVRVVAIDGWTALNAYLPPKERRGLVLIDPSFEEPDEFVRLADRFAAAYRKWPSGIYLLWYPIKKGGEADRFGRRLGQLGIGKILRAEFMTGAQGDPDRLGGCGVVIVNPPWKLESEIGVLLPALAAVLGRAGTGRCRCDWLAREK